MTREQICEQTARSLERAGELRSISATVGLDGFVDSIIDVVDKRHSADRYEPVRTIEAFGKKVLAAAGASSNYELVIKQQKLGGNGPIMANALASLGLDVTYIGNLGYPAIHPAFAEFARRAKVHSIAEPGATDALEFEDGKLMLNKLGPLLEVNWQNLLGRVGIDALRGLMNRSRLIGMVNWTMLPAMSDIWAHLLEILAPDAAAPRMLFADLADPEKRTAADIREALELLTRFEKKLPVTLGLNLKEAGAVARVLGLSHGDAEEAIEDTARLIRGELQIDCVVIHPRKGAAAATADHSAAFAGPFVRQPKISTGAGDHFNAGFCLGRLLGMDLEQSLCVGVGTSGYYVRSGMSPTADDLARFIATLPPPQT